MDSKSRSGLFGEKRNLLSLPGIEPLVVSDVSEMLQRFLVRLTSGLSARDVCDEGAESLPHSRGRLWQPCHQGHPGSIRGQSLWYLWPDRVELKLR
jgi:hypothetical protein